MYTGVLAFLERSLRFEARSRNAHVTRLLLVFVVYLGVIFTILTSGMYGAPGWLLLRNFARLTQAFMTVFGVSYFASTITEEKEDENLGLILMTGVSPLGILLGKAGSRLFTVLLLLLIQYPFMLFTITLGGVNVNQIRALYLGLAAYLVMLVGIGMLISTLSRSNRSAIARMWVVVFCYWLIPYSFSQSAWIASVTQGTMFAAPVEWIAESCLFTQIGHFTTTGFQQAIFSPQVITNSLLGVMAFLAAWAVFGVATRTPDSEPASRGLLPSIRSRFRWLGPGRVRGNALIWRDFYFVAGGAPGIIMRLLFYSSLLAASGVYSQGFSRAAFMYGQYKDIAATHLNLMIVALSFDAGLLVARSLGEEFRQNTFSVLTLLPYSIGQILYSKIMGSLLVWLTGFFCLLASLHYLPHGWRCFTDFLDTNGLWLLYSANLILIPHLAAVCALWLRMGALPLAICLAIGSMFSLICVLVVAKAPGDQGYAEVEGIGVLFLCLLCHGVVWARACLLANR